MRKGGGEGGGGGRSLPVGFEALVLAHVSSTLADCSLIAVIEFTPYVLIAIAYLCTHPMQNQDTRTDVAHKPVVLSSVTGYRLASDPRHEHACCME